MKYLNLGLVMLLGVFSRAALAQEESQANRANLKAGVLLGAGAIGGNSTYSSLKGEYYLTPSDIIDFGVASMKGEIKEEADKTVDGDQLYYVGVSTKLEGKAIFVGYKHFFSNSFFVRGGLWHEKVKGEFTVSKDVLATSEDVTQSIGWYSALNMQLGIGNQWQWESFTLGCEWIGSMTRLGHSHEFELNQASATKSGQEFMELKEKNQATLLNVFLGFAF